MKVSLVGAGPGDPGLLTIKGKELLQNADVIIYDALANPVLLSLAKKSAEIIYVGKIADKHALPQSEINALLADKAREGQGKTVVRLKGGDPYIFGRGGEEAEYLSKHGIPFEEVPGISSAIAAPAYAGIPLTHRNFTSSLTVIAGHESPDKQDSSINWDALAKSNSTLVFLMGMKNLANIVSSLISAGMDPAMPAALVYRGTTSMQKSLFSTLAELPKEAQKQKFSNPSIIIIGKVTSLHSELDWFSKKPLHGKRILVTRAREQASQIARMLDRQGAEVIEFPLIQIVPVHSHSDLDNSIKNLKKYDWIIFTSVNGVRFFWERLIQKGEDSRKLHGMQIAAIGPGTANSLRKHGIEPDFIPDEYIAESLAAGLAAKEGNNLQDKRILLPRAKNARAILADELKKMGAVVDEISIYETIPPTEGAQKLKSIFEEKNVDCITFGSSSTVANFFKLIDGEFLKKYPQLAYAVIGPVTAATLESNEIKTDIQPLQYTIPDLVNAIVEFYSRTPTSNG